MATLQEIEQRRAERRAAHDKAREEQVIADLEAIDLLEMATGEPLHTMTSNGYKAGVSVKLAFRAPTAVEYKRYCDMVGKASKKGDAVEQRQAQELLALACLVYPAPASDEGKAMLAAFPGLPLSLAIEVAKVAEMRAEDEGKS